MGRFEIWDALLHRASARVTIDTAFQNSSPEGQKNLKYLKLKKILINKHIFQINKIFYN